MNLSLDKVELYPALPDEQLHYRKKTLLHTEFINNSYEFGFIHQKKFYPLLVCHLHDLQINSHLENLRIALAKLPFLPIKFLLIHRNQLLLVLKLKKDTGLINLMMDKVLPGLPLENIHGFHLHFNPSTGNRIIQKNVLETLHGSRFSQDENGFYYSPLTFTQHQTRMLHMVIEKTIKFFDDVEKVFDLYGGTGITTYFFKQNQMKTTLIENHPDSIACARLNNPDAEILQGNNYDRMNQLFEKSRKFDAIYLNPPRNGLDDQTLHLILKFNPSKIAYLSCNPHSLKRDLKIFLHHNYQLVSTNLFDFFPFTFHIETLVLLQKIS